MQYKVLFLKFLHIYTDPNDPYPIQFYIMYVDFYNGINAIFILYYLLYWSFLFFFLFNLIDFFV